MMRGDADVPTMDDTAANTSRPARARGALSRPRRLAAVRRTGLLDTGPEEPFDRLTRLAATLLGTPFAFITVVDDRRSFWKSRVGVGAAQSDWQQRVEASFCRYVIDSGAPLIVTDTRADPLTHDNLLIQSMGVAAWAGFPIHAPTGEILGTFSVADTLARDFTPHDIEVLETLSHAVTGEIALRAALRDVQQTSAAALRAAEQAKEATAQAQAASLLALQAADESAMLARTLQESLLPPHLPHIPGVQVAARYLRGGHGADVLGDFYDVFHSTRDNWAIVVGDVSGKGPAAAKTTALARYTLRAAAARCATPSINLATLNTALLEWFTDDSQFLTVVYATARPHPRGLAIRVSRGGHEPALIRRANGRVDTLGHPGMILGCMPDAQLTNQRSILHPGDTLVLHTDGVTEARRPRDRDLFGDQRLHQLLADCAATTADDIAAAIENAVLDHSRRHISDDTAILVVHVPGAGHGAIAA
jgi:serine phosphatase RsbU (regulator of sigma subunit)